MAAIHRINIEDLAILSLKVSKNSLTAEISDGRVVSIPVSWFEKLSLAPLDKLMDFEISPSGYGVHWPELDEDISIKSFINP